MIGSSAVRRRPLGRRPLSGGPLARSPLPSRSGLCQRRQRGFVIVLFAVMLIPFLGMIALVVDVGRLHLARDRLENASARALLAAARAHDRDNGATPGLLDTVYADTLQLNFSPRFIGGIQSVGSSLPTITVSENDSGREFRVEAQARMRLLLMDNFLEMSGAKGLSEEDGAGVDVLTVVQRYGSRRTPIYRLVQ